MKRLFLFLMLGVIALVSSCSKTEPFQESVSSPNGDIVFQAFTNAEGALAYTVTYKGKTVVDTSALGFKFRDQRPLKDKLELISTATNSKNSIWKTQWGEDHFITEKFNELTLFMQEARGAKRALDLRIKVYDDGLGFRYEFPEQDAFEETYIDNELTEFKMTGDHTAWWIPADYDSYEYHFTESRISEIDSSRYNERLAANTIMEKHAANTPLTMKSDEEVYLSIHEANLSNYPGMTLNLKEDKRTFEASLVPSREGWKARFRAPFVTPWRTLVIGDSPGDLLTSKTILNLNEPSVLEDHSWIKPGKYVGVWWEMHLKKSAWDYASGKHGATTANAKRYIDFAAEHGFDGVLVEGWNTGWERWYGFPDREGIFDFITPYPDYDLPEVADYAKSKGVEIVMHHETSAAPRTYEQQLDTAFQVMEKYDMHTVKTGYVGPIIPDGEYHHGQWMVSHYRRVLDKATQYKIMVLAHEPIKPTGLRRTYPNMMAREGVRGSEFNSPGGRGNPPEHLTIVPFTRMLAGPIDYTPGLFKLQLDEYSEKGYTVPTTLAYQLAEYVVVYSPWQMASDLVEHYKGHPALQFIKDVPTDWEETKVINAEIGDYVTIARLERNGYDWYLGSLTDENAREFDIKLDFLLNNVTYEAQIYRDADDSHYQTNPEAFIIEKRKVKRGDSFHIKLSPGGGLAVRFKVQ